MIFFKRKEEKKLWEKCPNCKNFLYLPELIENLRVCPLCSHHFYLPAKERISSLLRDYKLLFEEVKPSDPLNFKDRKPYKDRLKEAQKKTGVSEALLVAKGYLGEFKVILGAMEFNFIGGSMGTAVGERFLRACELAREEKIPFIVITASGGARMQEGIFSLMQMVRTLIGVKLLKEGGVPYISVLTNPTMGGVSASFAFMGDVILAEPKALIGFAGPRVIEQTIKEKLPEGFQTAEFLQKKGQIDLVVDRRNLKETLIKILKILT